MGAALLMVGDISELIEACSATVFLFYLLVIIGLIIMRFTHREEPRLFKVSPLHNCLFLIFQVVLPTHGYAIIAGMVNSSHGWLHGVGIPLPYLPASLPPTHTLSCCFFCHSPWSTSLPHLCHGDTMEIETKVLGCYQR